MTNLCPVCMRGELAPASSTRTITYGGEPLAVPGVEHSLCPVCAEEVVLDEQAQRNDIRYADAKRAHDGLWTSDAIAAWRAKLQLSQRAAAKLMGGGANAFFKYERGEVIQSKPMDLLMRMSDEFPDVRRALAEKAGVRFERVVWQDADLVDKRETLTSLTKAVPAKQTAAGKIAAVLCDVGHYDGSGANDHSWHANEAYGHG